MKVRAATVMKSEVKSIAASMKARIPFRTAVLSALLGSMVLAPTAQADKETVGTILGAIAGGVAGHQFGDGRGRDVMTVVGALAGAYVGGRIGADLDSQDREQAAQAEISAFQYSANERYVWNGNAYGSRSVMQSESFWTRQGRHSQFRDCRESYSTIRTRNGKETYGSVWCQSGSGWSRIEDRSVIESISWCDSGGCTTQQSRTTTRMEERSQSRGYVDVGRGSSGSRRLRDAGRARDAGRGQPVGVGAEADWLVDDRGMYGLMIELNRISSDENRIQMLNRVYTGLLSVGKFLTVDQLALILSTFANDRSRIQALQMLNPVVDRRFGNPANVLVPFRESTSRAQAERILRN